MIRVGTATMCDGVANTVWIRHLAAEAARGGCVAIETEQSSPHIDLASHSCKFLSGAGLSRKET